MMSGGTSRFNKKQDAGQSLSLFTEHFDKHPIIILKDIKFTELQSMIDYMYEGEVNISQDQLPSFLKAAASIQLKGLTQNVKAETPLENAAKPLPQLNSARQSGGLLSNGQMPGGLPLNVELEEGQQRKKRKMDTHPPSSASSSPSLVPDLVVPNVILDVPGENNGSGGGGNTPNGQSQGAGGNNGQNNDNMKKEPSEYSGRSDDEEEDGISHDGWDLSNDGLQDSNSTLSAGDRSGPGALHHATPGGNRSAGGPGALSATGGPDMSNVDENNQDCQFNGRGRRAPPLIVPPPDHLKIYTTISKTQR
ncbi:hypothetical protein M8J75_013488 [Diaphorina citri]|nr:hypothetical protein M8J75_013488 [Diaphorina citri]